MRPKHMAIEPPPPQNQRKRGGKAKIIPSAPVLDLQNEISESTAPDSVLPSHSEGSSLECEPEMNGFSPQFTTEDALSRVAPIEPVSDPNTIIQSDNLYCPECYLPLHPDPKPEKLYIFLHAMKYTTSLGAFSTEMPEWAAEGWVWDRS
jgi:tRNA pseudouridine synthase 9